MPDKEIKAVHVPDGVPLPSSPGELARAFYKSADRKLPEELDEEPYAASSVEEMEGVEKRRESDK